MSTSLLRGRLGRRFPLLALAGIGAALALPGYASAALTWNGATSGNWSEATNWTPNATPSVDTNNPDDLTFPSISGTRAMTNDLTGVAIHNISVTSGLYSLAGNTITIAGTTPTFSNSSGGSGTAMNVSAILSLNTTLTTNNTAATRIEFSGDLTGTGGVTIGGTGTTRFSGTAKTYSGETTVSSGFLDLVTVSNLLPFGAGKGNLTIASGATLLDENVNVSVNGLNGAGTINRSTGSNTRGITIGNNDANGNFTGNIVNNGTGAYSITKVGAGTQYLATITTNAGVNVNAGALFLTSSVAATGSTIAASATLGGTTTATFSGAFNVNGNIAPGNAGVGAMSISTTAATFSSTSSLAIEIGGNIAGTGYDQLNLTNAAGTVTLDPAATLAASLVNGYTPTPADVDFILTRADSGTFANGFAGLAEGATVNLGNGTTAHITYQANWTGSDATSSLTGGNDIALYNFQSTAVPEPASLSALALGGLALLVRRRK